MSHFLQKLEILSEPQMLPLVTQLQARAQGEVTISEVMQELVAWGQIAE